MRFTKWAVILAACAALAVAGSTKETKLTAADAAFADQFGSDVGISGDTVIVGAAFDDDGGDASGSAHVFVRSAGAWSRQQKLTAADAAAGDEFGHAVAIDGGTAVVGAFRDDNETGAVYVFVRSGTTWSQQQKLVASDAAEGDFFGNSVDIDGDTIVVGAFRNRDEGFDTGSAYVFVRTGTTWSQQQKLVASDGGVSDLFGNAVAIDGDTILVGAFGDNDLGFNSGSAYVFVDSGGSWSEQEKLTAGDPDSADFFGVSVALDRNVAVIGAHRSDDVASDSGSAYVFRRKGSNWSQEQKLTASDPAALDLFGISVAVRGSTIVVGSYKDDDDATNSGSVYFFARSGGSWAEDFKLTAGDAGAGDQFGYAVDVDGRRLAVAAPLDDHVAAAAGSVYLYEDALSDPGDDAGEKNTDPGDDAGD